MVPHVAARQTHRRLQEISLVPPKRLLQQYPPEAVAPVKSDLDPKPTSPIRQKILHNVLRPMQDHEWPFKTEPTKATVVKTRGWRHCAI